VLEGRRPVPPAVLLEALGPGPGGTAGSRPDLSEPDAPGEVDPELVEALRRLRTELARARGVPPYVIFHDRTLRAIARARPRTEQQLLAIEGIGPAKLARYGARILALLTTAGAG
ncbi:MAG: ATP-dependent DNA helicase RecQ, partial [Deltaproteobacteria bacterium]